MSINQNNIYGNNNVNIGPQQRHIDDNLKQQLKSLLQKNEGIDLNASFGDGEATMFAEEIKAYLTSEGYEVNGVNQCMWSSPQKGQSINPNLVDGKRQIIIGHNVQ